MNDSFTRKKAKCAEAIKGVILLMRKNGIPIPSKYQKSRVHEDLPPAPELREAEIVRRFRYLEPENRDHIADKLNDLLVYAEVAKELKSEMIAIIVLSKLRKWEDLLLNPQLEVPPLPHDSPEQRRRLLQRKKNIEERDLRTANVLRQYEEHGESRRDNIQSINQFEDNIRTIKLPPQTIRSPQAQFQGATARVDLDERRRTDLENYQKFGAIRKRLHDLPEFDRNLGGTRLPVHGLPPTTTQNPESAHTQAISRELLQQRRMDVLKRQLYEFMANRNTSDQPAQLPTPSPERRRKLLEQKQNIEERDRRVAASIRQYEEQGEHRRAAVQTMNPFGHVRTTTLPPQTIDQTSRATAARIDLDEQRRREIEKYKRLGATKKRLFELPDYERDLGGPRLPAHGLRSQDQVQSQFKILQKQREMDNLKRQLQEAITSRKRMRSDDTNSSPESNPDNNSHGNTGDDDENQFS